MENDYPHMKAQIHNSGWDNLPVDVDISEPDGFTKSSLGISKKTLIYLIVAFAGAIGALSRYLIEDAISVSHNGFPWNTFIINITGTFLLSLVMVLVLERFQSSTLVRPLIATGFCGAYTTFSTFMVDASLLIKYNDYETAVLYLFMSLLCGLAVTLLGMYLARFLYKLDLAIATDLGAKESEDKTYQDA